MTEKVMSSCTLVMSLSIDELTSGTRRAYLPVTYILNEQMYFYYLHVIGFRSNCIFSFLP